MPDVIDRSSGDDLKHMCMASSSWKQAFCDPGILRNAVLHLKLLRLNIDYKFPFVPSSHWKFSFYLCNTEIVCKIAYGGPCLHGVVFDVRSVLHTLLSNHVMFCFDSSKV